MVDEVREVEERPRETVVVERDSPSSSLGTIIAVILLALFLLFLFFVWNPFAGDGDGDVDVNVPTPNVEVNPPENINPDTTPQ